jgi:hypothetical protein
MSDEYYQRYNRYTHDQLYKLLQQGSPATTARQGDAWRQAGQTAATLAGALRRDLVRLSARWTGLGSDEFDVRIKLVVTFAQKLADEAASIGVGAEALSRALAEAQRQAEPNPAGPVSGSEPAAVRAALRNAARNGTAPEAVLGSDLGHVPGPDEQSAAFERMVTLVAELAALYGVVDQANWPRVIPDAPAGMPGTVTAGAAPVAADGLAGAGVIGPDILGPGPVTGLDIPVGGLTGAGASPPVPASMLAGAGPGLAQAARPAVGGAPVAGPAGTGATSSGAMAAGMPMMMAGGGVIGHQPGGGSVEAGLSSGGTDAWRGQGGAWLTGGDGSEPPDAVVGDLA